MDIKDLTITFRLESDVDAYGFLDDLFGHDGRNWPDCLYGMHIESDIIRPATPAESQFLGTEDDNDN